MKESEALEASLAKVKGASKVAKTICDLIVFVILIVWVGLVVFSLLGRFSGEGPNPFSVNLGTLIYFSVILALMAAFVRVVAVVFAGVVRGESPFRREQVKRMRLMAYLMIAKAAAEALFSVGNSSIMQLDNWTFMCIDSGLFSGKMFYVDAGSLFLAAVIICLSIVFEYGTLLQRLSDDAA